MLHFTNGLVDTTLGVFGLTPAEEHCTANHRLEFSEQASVARHNNVSQQLSCAKSVRCRVFLLS
jgi:hypothetical protein